MTSQGIHAGSAGKASELINPTPNPIATMTKVERRITKAMFDIGNTHSHRRL